MSNSTGDSEFPTNYDYLLKILLLGDPLVGKSYILSQYIRGDFDLEQKNTIGVEFDLKEYVQPQQPLYAKHQSHHRVSDTHRQKKIVVQLWDTAGQEKFISIMPSYFHAATGALLVFDVTKQQTFENCKKWYDMIKEMGDEHIQIVLVGNKTDLNNLRIVSQQDAENFAKARDMKYIEVSALESKNIDEAVSLVVEDIKVMLQNCSDRVETNKSISLRHRVDIQQRNQCCGTGGMI